MPGQAHSTIGPGSRKPITVTVAVYSSETRAFALRRRRKLRPDHAGRLLRFEHRRVPRTELAELFATQTSDELQAMMDSIEANGRGEPIGGQVLAEAPR
jgi:hypothetical protein